MISFKIPTNKLRLFLIALNMNFSLPEPDYVFQVPDGFEVVYTKEIPSSLALLVDDFVLKMWHGHSGPCDLDPVTLKIRRYERGWKTCDMCAGKLQAMKDQRKNDSGV